MLKIILSQILLLEAAKDKAGGGGILSLLGGVAPFIILFAVMYFLMIRPQRKREKKLREEINAMQVGDSIVTIGGIVGKIMNMTDSEVTISTSVANTMMCFKKSAISGINKPESAEDAKPRSA